MNYSDYINNKGQKSLNKVNNIVVRRANLLTKENVSFVLAIGSSAIASGIEAATILTDSTSITTHLVAGGLALIAAASAGLAIKYNHDYKALCEEDVVVRRK